MKLVAHLKRDWQDLRGGQPGRRFQERYDHAAHENGRSSWLVRGLKIGAGIACVLIGLAEIVFPGPAFVFLAIGGALLATQSRSIARAMDWAECRGRSVFRWAKGQWERASVALRAGLVTVAAALGAGGAVFTYRLFAD